MTEAGMLSIVRRGHIYQVRYASSNPYAPECSPYLCPDESALIAALRYWGIDAWEQQQAVTTLRRGGVAVLPVVLSEAHRQAYFSTPCAAHRGSAGDTGSRVVPSQAPGLVPKGKRAGRTSHRRPVPRRCASARWSSPSYAGG